MYVQVVAASPKVLLLSSTSEVGALAGGDRHSGRQADDGADRPHPQNPAESGNLKARARKTRASRGSNIDALSHAACSTYMYSQQQPNNECTNDDFLCGDSLY